MRVLVACEESQAVTIELHVWQLNKIIYITDYAILIKRFTFVVHRVKFPILAGRWGSLCFFCLIICFIETKGLYLRS